MAGEPVGLSWRAHFFERSGMWKIVVGFIVFAAIALFVLSRGGEIDMSGEKHGDTTHVAEPAAATPANPASAPQ